MIAGLKQRISALAGQLCTGLCHMSSSWGLEVVRAQLQDGQKLVVKTGVPDLAGQLECEGNMLKDLGKAGLPVPQVFHTGKDMLIMEWIETAPGGISTEHQRHAGELIAALHTRPAPFTGYSYDTVIGALPQPNPKTRSWLEFFGEHRLIYMANLAHIRTRLPASYLARIETLAQRLDRYISEPDHPSLLHGDLWGGNVLTGKDGKIAAFIDPAIYYGHPEIELAFTQMFATFSRPFFEAYAASAPFEKDFFDIRCDLYNLYPTLVHTALFGSSYLPPIDRTLKRLGL